MSLLNQIIYGSLMLGLCIFVQLSLFYLSTKLLRFLANVLHVPMRGGHWAILFAVEFAVVIFAHTAHVWIWALTFVVISALPSLSDAVYFALVTYTTLGYGDVVVSDGYRTFSAMAAVTGMLSFGLSTAFLVEVLTRLMPKRM